MRSTAMAFARQLSFSVVIVTLSCRLHIRQAGSTFSKVPPMQLGRREQSCVWDVFVCGVQSVFVCGLQQAWNNDLQMCLYVARP